MRLEWLRSIIKLKHALESPKNKRERKAMQSLPYTSIQAPIIMEPSRYLLWTGRPDVADAKIIKTET